MTADMLCICHHRRTIDKEGEILATSSIFHNIVINDPETAERLIAALEASEQQSKNMPRAQVARLVTDEAEIRELVSKWTRKNDITD